MKYKSDLPKGNEIQSAKLWFLEKKFGVYMQQAIIMVGDDSKVNMDNWELYNLLAEYSNYVERRKNEK